MRSRLPARRSVKALSRTMPANAMNTSMISDPAEHQADQPHDEERPEALAEARRTGARARTRRRCSSERHASDEPAREHRLEDLERDPADERDERDSARSRSRRGRRSKDPHERRAREELPAARDPTPSRAHRQAAAGHDELQSSGSRLALGGVAGISVVLMLPLLGRGAGKATPPAPRQQARATAPHQLRRIGMPSR